MHCRKAKFARLRGPGILHWYTDKIDLILDSFLTPEQSSDSTDQNQKHSSLFVTSPKNESPDISSYGDFMLNIRQSKCL